MKIKYKYICHKYEEASLCTLIVPYHPHMKIESCPFPEHRIGIKKIKIELDGVKV